MQRELISLTYEAGLSSEERELILTGIGEIDEVTYNELLKTLSERQINPLARVRNGELVLMRDLNKAVKQAANDPTT